MLVDYRPLWYWVCEREAIRLRKAAGVSQREWTADPILKTYRFCNVRREDDRVTAWIKKYVRTPYAGNPNLWFMLAIARQINWPDTIAELIRERAWPDAVGFHPRRITSVLNSRQLAGHKIYTGAYMISAPPDRGADKQRYVAEVILGDLWSRRQCFQDWNEATLRGTHAKIMKSKGLGTLYGLPGHRRCALYIAAESGA